MPCTRKVMRRQGQDTSCKVVDQPSAEPVQTMLTRRSRLTKQRTRRALGQVTPPHESLIECIDVVDGYLGRIPRTRSTRAPGWRYGQGVAMQLRKVLMGGLNPIRSIRGA